MLRRNVIGIVAAALLSTAALAAQIKEMPRTPIKPINEAKVVDINTGSETELVNLGIERTVAKRSSRAGHTAQNAISSRGKS